MKLAPPQTRPARPLSGPCVAVPHIPLTYPFSCHLAPLPGRVCQSRSVCTDTTHADAAWLRHQLPDALWQDLLHRFADVDAPGTPATLADSLKRSSAAAPPQPTRVPFAVQWLSAILEQTARVSDKDDKDAHHSPKASDAAALVATLSRLVVAVYGITATAWQRTQDSHAPSVSFLLVLFSFRHWFEAALGEAQARHAAHRLDVRRLQRKRVPSRTDKHAVQPAVIAADPADQLRRLLLVHAARWAHPARFFERTLHASVPALPDMRAATERAVTLSLEASHSGVRTTAGASPAVAPVMARPVRRAPPPRRRRPRSPSSSISSVSSVSSVSSMRSSSSEASDEKETSVKAIGDPIGAPAREKTLAEMMAAPSSAVKRVPRSTTSRSAGTSHQPVTAKKGPPRHTPKTGKKARTETS